MRDNHQTLTDVGDKAKTASGWFAETEHQNTIRGRQRHGCLTIRSWSI